MTSTSRASNDAAHPWLARLAEHPWAARIAELARFGSVGAVAYVVDVGLFNLLRFGPGEVLGHKPLTAKIISVTVATLVSWLGNRYWTFSGQRTQSRGKELAAFALVNVGGMGIGVGCLWFSHYVLDLTSPLADNVSANGVGLVLGMVFRYLAYRNFVFTGGGAPEVADDEAILAADDASPASLDPASTPATEKIAPAAG